MGPRVIVAGSIGAAALAYGGNSWAFLQWILGLRALGCETTYVEYLEARRSVDASWRRVPFAASANARYFGALIERFGISSDAALLDDEGPGHVGLDRAEVERRARAADLVVNLSGRLHERAVLDAARRRMYVDLDPGYTQIWQEQYGVDMNVRGHDVYLTVGLNLGQPDCPLPTCGVRWETTLPPIVLDDWKPVGPPGAAYTTVADWRGFKPVEWRGIWYGQKADEFLRIVDLPRRVDVPLELCLFIHDDESDHAILAQHGWRIVSPAERTATPDAYRDYILGSRGEFTVVKTAYAAGRTGWFSDRSACYLASGRPVIVQDTGIARWVPTGRGLLTFTDADSAADALVRVERDYAAHAAAATAFARDHLDARAVLGRILSLAGL
jgi:hypothetical protein